MDEKGMASAVRGQIDMLARISDGVYIFNAGGKYGTIKNYQQDESHWQVMFDNLTAEQVVELFGGARTCHDVCGDIAEFTCSECGFDCDLTGWISLFDGDTGRHRHHHHGTPKFCPNCGFRVVSE